MQIKLTSTHRYTIPRIPTTLFSFTESVFRFIHSPQFHCQICHYSSHFNPVQILIDSHTHNYAPFNWLSINFFPSLHSFSSSEASERPDHSRAHSEKTQPHTVSTEGEQLRKSWAELVHSTVVLWNPGYFVTIIGNKSNVHVWASLSVCPSLSGHSKQQIVIKLTNPSVRSLIIGDSV